MANIILSSEIDDYVSFGTKCLDETPQARDAINHGCDGPITPFVLIMRACELVEEGKYDVQSVANALDLELCERGWLAENAIEVTGT